MLGSLKKQQEAYKPLNSEVYQERLKQKRIAIMKKMMKQSNISTTEL